MNAAPRLDWTDIEGLPEVVAALGGSDKVRLVGGCVRDRLLGHDVGDIDLATRHRPDKVVEMLEAAGLRAIPTGIDHGTITALSAGRPFEITTLRRDVETDGRHAVVEYSDDWAEDAARRDFTINALYCDAQSGEVFDYVGGLGDMEGPHVRFIGDAAQRIAEDHLRILRYFRFMARFAVTVPDAEALEACRAAGKSLMTLSRERIASELVRLLDVTDPSAALDLMAEIDLFDAFLPEVQVPPDERMAALVKTESEAGVDIRPERRLALLLPVDTALLAKVAARLKLSNRFRQSLIAIANAREGIGRNNVRQLAYRFGPEAAIDALLIDAAMVGCDATSLLVPLTHWEVPHLPVKGGDLIARGLPAGPVVSQALRAIEARWITADFPTDGSFEDIVANVLGEIRTAH